MHQSLEGGYNGGGPVTGMGWNHYTASGGGATHIATRSGVLSELSSYKSDILIVSGGGGGARDQYNHEAAARWGNGGSGGGSIGGYVYSSYGGMSLTPVIELSATQNSGYAFGKGETGNGNSGGGGGYYGGYSGDGTGGSNYYTGAGAGGSGYIGRSSLTNKFMFCYNCPTSNATSTQTSSTTCISSTPTANCAKRGNGYAKITILSTSG